MAAFTHAAAAPAPQRFGAEGSLHDIPQTVPLHVACPLTGLAQAAQEVAPHELAEVLPEQRPLQSWDPVGQTQTPAWQILSMSHATPQPPQLALSVVLSTQALPHKLSDPPQALPQAPPSQVAVPSEGATHPAPQAPQFCGSVMTFAHVPLQFISPTGQDSVHANAPPLTRAQRVVVPPQTAPHRAQLDDDCSDVAHPVPASEQSPYGGRHR